MPFIHTSLFRLFFPITLISVLFIGRSNVALLIETNAVLALNLPYLLFGFCVILSHSFNQRRMGMIAIAMALAYWIIQVRLQSPLNTGTTQAEFYLLALLFPIGCITVFIFPEKRFFSLSSIGYVAILAGLFGWATIIIQDHQQQVLDIINRYMMFDLTAFTSLPILLILFHLFLLGLSAIGILTRHCAADVAIFTSIAICSLTLIFWQYPYISTSLFILGGLLLIVAIMMTSHELAYIDQLTGIPGRRALETEMGHLGRKFSIAMLDIDHFKKFNDTYGHDTGDDVLRLVATQLVKVKGKARVYRYGGEEFTVLFKGKYSDEATPFLDELREDIANYAMTVRNQDKRPKSKKDGVKSRGNAPATKTVNITVSIGVADSLNTRKPAKVIKMADEALYRAKDGGRNRVAV